jgi:transcriptional regulator with XRE-family HTH domain
MSMEVVGIYLRALRELQGLGRPDIEKQTDVSEDTIARIEKGENDPRYSMISRIMEVLGASPEDVYWLQTDRTATPDDAQRLARARVAFLRDPQSAQEADADIRALEAVMHRMEGSRVREMRQLIRNLVGLFGGDAVGR